MSLEGSWSRLGMEAFVVVVSILLALAVDEWRDGLANRALEREYLERLRQDLGSNLEEIDQRHAAQASELESARLVYPLVAWGDWKGLDTARAVRASYLATPSPTPSCGLRVRADVHLVSGCRPRARGTRAPVATALGLPESNAGVRGSRRRPGARRLREVAAAKRGAARRAAAGDLTRPSGVMSWSAGHGPRAD